MRERLAQERKLDPAIINLLRTAPKDTLPMDVLRTAVSALSFYDPDDKNNDHDANVRKAIRLTSQIAMIVAAYDRIRKGQAGRRAGSSSLSHAGNFLLQLNGAKPSETAERAFDIALILHADHELNASTFAARVIAATLSDMHSATTSAIGALKGPLHGGANEAVFRILDAIDNAGADPGRVHQRHAGAEEESSRLRPSRLPHRRSRAPRTCARCHRTWASPAGKPSGSTCRRTSRSSSRAEKKLNANVDFYSASTYHTLGIDVDLFTPVFAVSRISGWTAHVIEQLDDNRLIRPRADYIGPAYPQHYVPMERR